MKQKYMFLVGILWMLCLRGHLFAQESLSATLAAPWTSRLGGQLIYFYEDGNSVAGTPSGSRGNWRSNLVLTNVHPTAKVKIHFQFYDSSLNMLMDFADYVNAAQRVTIDPQDIRRPSDNIFIGKITDGIYVLAATPVNPDFPANAKVIPFNWLTGEVSIRCQTNGSNTVYNAVSRLAVAYDGSRIDPTYTTVAGFEGTALYLDGVNRLFQQFRPKFLYVSSLFAPGGIIAGVPFGNRLTFLGFQDSYGDPAGPWVIKSSNISVSTFLFDILESTFSVPSRNCSGLKEYTLSPNTAGAADY